MHNHGVHSNQFEQHHIFGKCLLQCRIRHGIATVLDDHGFAVVLADVGQGLRQNVCLVAWCKGFAVCGFSGHGLYVTRLEPQKSGNSPNAEAEGVMNS
jgi:hypothetical protein